MIYKVLSNLQTGKGTFVAGDEVEMSEEEAKHLVEDGILKVVCEKPEEPEVPETPPEEKEGEEEEINLKTLTVAELKGLAEEKEIDIEGITKKADIIKAIKKAE
jgi:hypothetical protein